MLIKKIVNIFLPKTVIEKTKSCNLQRKSITFVVNKTFYLQVENGSN